MVRGHFKYYRRTDIHRVRGPAVRGEKVKRGHFTDPEKMLLRDLLYGESAGRDHMHLVENSVFGMTKAAMERAMLNLSAMPLPLGNDRKMGVIVNLAEKLEKQLKKLAEDERRQQEKKK